ncbi:MAG TPA: AAA family ATPase [Terriglobales bacterium]
MRKWMRERLKRRKKTGDKPEPENKPAPLRPAYFDVGPEPPPVAAENVREPGPAVSESRAEKPQPAEEPPTVPSPEAASGGRRRRRRGRGGRGRGAARGGSAGSAAPAPLAEQIPPLAPPTPRVAPPAPARPPKGLVVLAIGLPGSGKSSWFKRHKLAPLSSDLLRSLLFDDPDEQRYQDLVFSNLRSMLRARLIARRPVNYVDATNLTPQERGNWVKLAKDYEYEVQAVYFDVPLEVCLERNQRRQRVVSEDVMRRMAAKLRPPSFEEGFTKITVVRVKQK